MGDRTVNVEMEQTILNETKCEKSIGVHIDSLDNAIDDQEFDIPPIQHLPTLESILNASEDDELKLQNSFLLEGLDSTDNWEVTSISSQESFTTSSSSTPVCKKPKLLRVQTFDKHGIVFRHVKLKSISYQLLSAADKVDAGMPTALAVSTLIAIGTSHGLVLIFDSNQVLRWCLGSTAVGAQYGAVSALSFNVDCTRLLCGFARGQITMWNLTNGKLLRTVLDAHPPGTAILHVKFTDDRTVAVTSDSGGSVFQLEFKRTMGVRSCDSHCLFSGSRGEACIVEPLCTQQAIPNHPMKDVAILAMASLSKVLVVVIKPHLKVHYVQPLPGDPSTLPLLNWQYVVIQVSENNKIIDPVLAFARDQSLYFAQVVCHNADDIKVSLLQKMNLSYKLLAMTWINSRSMVLVDTSERAHLVDIKTEEEIQVLDLADVQLVYSTSFYKSLATGGNVSRALAYAGDRACYQSVVTFNNQLVLLGTQGVHVLTLRSWSERINALLRQGKYQHALDLGLAFYKGEAKAVVGLSWNPIKRKAAVNELMKSVLLQYVDVSFTTCPSKGKIEELKNHFQEVVDACLNYCIASDNSEFLFGILYDKLSKELLAKEVFLVSLVPFILEDRLSYVKPSVMQHFVKHFEGKEELETVELCILHLDISSLDIHQVVSLCRLHKLYDALFHIYNKGMGDYVTPLIDLLDQLNSCISTSKKELPHEEDKLGNKILVYISCCLSGHAYPLGEIPEDKVNLVREQVLLCITSLHSSSFTADEPVYPYLKALILFNTREFFNALSLAFQDSQLKAKEKQRVVDILLLLMIENGGFTTTQIGILFVFLGRQISQGNSGIVVKSVLFEQVLETLCTSDRSRHEEREQIMIDFLRTGVLEQFLRNQPQEELRMITLASSAGFYRVVEMLHIRQRQYTQALATYWKDASRGHKIFSFIKEILSDESVTSEEKENLKKDVVDNLDQLVRIDPKKTAHLVLHRFGAGMSEVLVRFMDEDNTLFQFLQGAFEYLGVLPEEKLGDKKKAARIDATVLEKYVDLMCKFGVSQDNVIEFLSKNSNYRNDVVLSICKQHSAKDVTCFLLERSGDLFGAFSLNLEILEKVMTSNKKPFVESRISKMLEFLQRNSRSMTTEQTHRFWFELLDLVLKKQQELKMRMNPLEKAINQDEMTAEWMRQATSRIMTTGMPYLPPALILQKIVSSPAYAAGRFAELRGLITNMMETCNYEQVLMKTCAKMAAGSLINQISNLKKSARRALSSGCDSPCGICSRKILLSFLDSNVGNEQIISFCCGHIYHTACMLALNKLDCVAENVLKCHICHKSDLTFQRPTPPSNLTSNEFFFDGGAIERDAFSKKFFKLQKSPSYVSILSNLNSKGMLSRQLKRNIFQSDEWLGQRLAAPPVSN